MNVVYIFLGKLCTTRLYITASVQNVCHVPTNTKNTGASHVSASISIVAMSRLLRRCDKGKTLRDFMHLANIRLHTHPVIAKGNTMSSNVTRYTQRNATKCANL